LHHPIWANPIFAKYPILVFPDLSEKPTRVAGGLLMFCIVVSERGKARRGIGLDRNKKNPKIEVIIPLYFLETSALQNKLSRKALDRKTPGMGRIITGRNRSPVTQSTRNRGLPCML